MLASEELKRQNKEALLIAEEAKKPRAASKASSQAAPTETVSKEPDLTGGIDIQAVRFPANVMMANSKSHFAVGNEYSNSMTVSGPVERVVLMPGGYCFGSVRTPTGLRWVVVMPTGMTAELA